MKFLKDFVKSRCSQDNKWNLIFFGLMVLNAGMIDILWMVVPKNNEILSKIPYILSLSGIGLIIWLCKRYNCAICIIADDQTKTFFSKDGSKINDQHAPVIFIFLFLGYFPGLFIYDFIAKIIPILDNRVFLTIFSLLATSTSLAIILNCPISLLFNSNLYEAGSSSTLFDNTYSTSQEAAKRNLDWIRNSDLGTHLDIRYSSLPNNIHNPNYYRR